jgi:hypothetical protein
LSRLVCLILIWNCTHINCEIDRATEELYITFYIKERKGCRITNRNNFNYFIIKKIIAVFLLPPRGFFSTKNLVKKGCNKTTAENVV